MSAAATAAPSLGARLQAWGPRLLLAGAVLYAVHKVYPRVDLSGPAAPAPDFETADLDGQPFRLSALRGRVVVLNFWATWCGPCRAELPAFAALHRALGPEGAEFVGVALDEEGWAVVAPFVAARGLPYRQLVDQGATIARAYGGITTVPTTVFIDRRGNVRYRHEGIMVKPAVSGLVRRLLREP